LSTKEFDNQAKLVSDVLRVGLLCVFFTYYFSPQTKLATNALFQLRCKYLSQ